MGRFFRARLVLAIVVLVGVLGIIQGFGGYLIEELSQFENLSPISNEPIEAPVVKCKTLRLDTESFYMLQVGVFNELAAGQHIVDQLAALGYRVYTTSEAPYHLWLGCFSDAQAMTEVPLEVREIGQDIYITQGLLNKTSLTFNDDAFFVGEVLVPIVEKSDVLLKHSLKMFRSARYADYSDAIWQEQIGRLKGEITSLTTDIENALLDAESEALAKPLVNYQAVLADYEQSLAVVVEKKNDKAVLLAQSYLQQLIGQYHQLIEDASQDLG